MTDSEPIHSPRIRARDLFFCSIHFLGWLFLLVYIPLFSITKLKEAWEECEIRLDLLSKMLVSWSDFVVGYWYCWVPLVLLIVLSTSVLMLFSPKSSLRTGVKTTSLLLMGMTAVTIAIGFVLPSLRLIPG